ncbi:hypothetical protein A2U01_0094463, partial [Trifolium medium]|nr:hypothetical protein [Trifolium medium]
MRLERFTKQKPPTFTGGYNRMELISGWKSLRSYL